MLTWLRLLITRTFDLRRRRAIDEEFQEEIASHYAMLVDEHLRRGMARSEAERAARVQLGNATQLRETNAELRGLPMFEALLQDVRYTFRMLRRQPGFTAVAVLTLGLGIGANTAIFSVVDAVLLRPLPFHDPDRLVRLYETEAAPGRYALAGPDFVDWKRRVRSFEDMALYSWPHAMNLSDAGTPEHVTVVPVEANFFALLGARPMLGRTFATGEDEPGVDHVAILEFGFWRTRFAGAADVVNRRVELDGQPYTIIGVMPAQFAAGATQLWIPQDMDGASLRNRGSHWASAIGRLKPGISLQQAKTELSLIAARLAQEYPGTNKTVGADVVPLQEDLVAGSRESLLIMLWAVALVLLIACANIANLLLSRALARHKEMAVRAALGAARSRLVRQLLTESVMLATLGAACGLTLAWACIRLLLTQKNFDLPPTNPIVLNMPVLAFTAALATLAGLLFGVFPALHISGGALPEDLRGAGALVGPGRQRRVTSNLLVVTEIGLSVLLLISAALLLKDFTALRRMPLGVRPDHVWTAAIQLPDSHYTTWRRRFEFSRALLASATALPHVEGAAVTSELPLGASQNGTYRPKGRSSGFEDVLVESHAVTPEYFRVMGIPLVEGREFTEQDLDHSQATFEREVAWFEAQAAPTPEEFSRTFRDVIVPVVVNESLATLFWPGESPLGRMFGQGNHGPWYQVIGVVGNVKQASLSQPPMPEMYDAVVNTNPLILVLRTSGSPAGVTPDVWRVLARLDSSLPLFSVRTIDQVIAEHAAGQQFVAMLLGLFAVLSLLLAVVGIYGVLSYQVTQRTREIGARIAFGASRSQVLSLVMGDASRLIGAGLAIGVGGAIAARRVLAGSLQVIKANDPATFIVATLCLALVAVAACYVPARRASRLDPMQALRQE